MSSSPPADLESMLSTKKGEARNLQLQLVAFNDTRSVFTSPDTHGSRTRRDGVRRGSNRTREKYLRELKVTDPARYLQLMQALADKAAADAGVDVDEPSADVQDDIDDDSGTQLPSVLASDAGDDDDSSTQLPSVLTADFGDNGDDEVVRVCCCVRFFAFFLF